MTGDRGPGAARETRGSGGGGNRQLREVLRLLGIPVKKLSRVAIGPVRLKALAVGDWRELTREELGDLRNAAIGRPPRARPARTGSGARPPPRNPRPHRADNHRARTPTRGTRS